MGYEDFLIKKHTDQYQGLADEIFEDYDNWIEGLDIEDFIKYAEDWHTAQMKEVLERLKYSDEVVKLSEALAIFNNRIDEELEKLTVK